MRLGTWWRQQMETFSALLAICAGNSPVNGEFPTQRPVTRSFEVFFDLRLNKRLSEHSWGWWFETPLGPLWRHCNEIDHISPPGTPDINTQKQQAQWNDRHVLWDILCWYTFGIITRFPYGQDIIIKVKLHPENARCFVERTKMETNLKGQILTTLGAIKAL